VTQQQVEDQSTTMHARNYKESLSLFGGDGGEDSGGAEGRRYYGKYRGAVVNNVDPLGQGRLLVTVPDVKGFLISSWAMPCVPFAGPAMGMYVVPPPIGAGVWVEFEQGDPDYPIWVGCFWDVPPVPPGEAGLLAQAATKTSPGLPFVSIETMTPGGPAGIGVTSTPVPAVGVPGVVTLFAGPASITLSAAGIFLSVLPDTMMTLTSAGITMNGKTIAALPTGAFSVNGPQFTVT
jgi:hypothetical protein